MGLLTVAISYPGDVGEGMDESAEVDFEVDLLREPMGHPCLQKLPLSTRL
jgi:hypothetical protein